jgi:hypothetical protein
VLRRLQLASGSLLVAKGVFFAAPPAFAHAAHLEWSAPPACPGLTELRAQVERLLGEALVEGRAFEAKAEVTPDEDQKFTLVLSVRTPEGEGTRRVRAETCEAALNVAAFGIALAINPELAVTANPPDAATGIVASPAPTPAPVAPPPEEPAHRPAPPRATPPSTPSPEVWLGARALLDTSLLPSPAAAFGAFADILVLEHIRAGFGGSWFVPQTHTLETGQGGLFSLWMLDVHACWQGRLGIPIAACPSFQFGRLSGEGRGVSPRLTQESWVLAPGLSVLMLPRVSNRVSVIAGASASFPLKHDSFVVNAGTVHEIPVVTLELWAGVALRAL